MDNTELYKDLVEGETSLPSFMRVLPKTSLGIFTQDEIKEKLEAKADFESVIIFEGQEEGQYLGTVIYEGESYEFGIVQGDLKENPIDIGGLAIVSPVEGYELEAAKKSDEFLECFMYFKEDSLKSYLVQLKILEALSNDNHVLMDLSSFRLMSGEWFKMAANSKTPPSPDYLYIIHVIYDEEDNQKVYWMHTHGLYRCGIVEIEMLGIKENPRGHYDSIRAIVSKFIENGVTREGEEILVGHNDGMDIKYAWLPWEKSLDKIAKKSFFGRVKPFLGDVKDREDGVHSGPSGVLFACIDRKYKNPDVYSSFIGENPVFFFTDSETKRMSDLAKERFEHFEGIFNLHKDEEWGYLVKIGCLVDGHESPTEREHLWFEVKEILDGKVKGELINSPYWIEAMEMGEEYTLKLEDLTDWIIYCEEEQLTPDSIFRYYQLYRNKYAN